MKYFEVNVEFSEPYEVNEPKDSYYLFQLIGKSGLCFMEEFPEKIVDGVVVPVYRLDF